MRDVIRQAERAAGLSPEYHVFAARLRAPAGGYEVQAIPALIERYLDESRS